MMSDFRNNLYNQYVTKFKGLKAPEVTEQLLQSYLAWCEYQFLPFLDELKHDDSILELGCGPGYMMEFLKKQRFSNVTGIDISEEQVEIAVKRGANAKVADVFEFLNSSPKQFQAIIAIDFVEHFSKHELMQLFPLINRSLKDQGILLIQTPNGAGLFPQQVIYGDLTHLTIFSPGSLQQILRISGFDNITFQETGPVAKNLKGWLRASLWRLVRFMSNTVRMIETGKTQAIWTENMICRCQKTPRL